MTEPGQICDGCNRRVPHKKKESTPRGNFVRFAIPAEDVEGWKEALDVAAQHVGLLEKPYYQYRTLTAALVLLLQAPANVLDGET
jgi:hypothetical protein